MRRTWWQLAVVAIVAGAALAGCGGSGDASSSQTSGADAAADAAIVRIRDAAGQATSVRIVGDVTGKSPLKIDLMLADGDRGKGTLTLSGVDLDVVRLGGDFYLRTTPETLATIFPDADRPRLADVGDRYVHAKADDPRLTSLAGILVMQRFVTELLKTDGALSSVPGQVIDGEATVGVRDSSENPGTIFARAADPAYPLLVESPSGATRGRLRLSGWNEPTDIVAPTGDLVVEASELGGS